MTDAIELMKCLHCDRRVAEGYSLWCGKCTPKKRPIVDFYREAKWRIRWWWAVKKANWCKDPLCHKNHSFHPKYGLLHDYRMPADDGKPL